MNKGAVFIETSRIPQRIVAQLWVVKGTIITFVAATFSPWAKHAEAFAPSWMAEATVLTVNQFFPIHTVRTLVFGISRADFGVTGLQ